MREVRLSWIGLEFYLSFALSNVYFLDLVRSDPLHYRKFPARFRYQNSESRYAKKSYDLWPQDVTSRDGLFTIDGTFRVVDAPGLLKGV